MVGSLLVHAALLIASARSAAAVQARPAAEPARPRHPTGAFLLHAKYPLWSSYWPRSPAVQACFGEAVLDPGNPDAAALADEVAYRSHGLQTWVRFATDDGRAPESEEVREALFREGLSDCASLAQSTGWSGKGRVFVRVTRESPDRTLAQALPLDDESKDPGLLCCLRESQEVLSRGIEPGRTVRYTFQMRWGGVEIGPPPM